MKIEVIEYENETETIEENNLQKSHQSQKHISDKSFTNSVSEISKKNCLLLENLKILKFSWKSQNLKIFVKISNIQILWRLRFDSKKLLILNIFAIFTTQIPDKHAADEFIKIEFDNDDKDTSNGPSPRL